MDQKLKQILQTIKYNDIYIPEFKNASVRSASLDKTTKILEVLIHNYSNLSSDAYNELEKSFKDFFNIEKVILTIEVEELDKTILYDSNRK